MKKGYKNKMAKVTSNKTGLRCIRECEAPRLGAWKVGDIIKDKEIVEIMKDNPCFETIKEGEK